MQSEEKSNPLSGYPFFFKKEHYKLGKDQTYKQICEQLDDLYEWVKWSRANLNYLKWWAASDIYDPEQLVERVRYLIEDNKEDDSEGMFAAIIASYRETGKLGKEAERALREKSKTSLEWKRYPPDHRI